MFVHLFWRVNKCYIIYIFKVPYQNVKKKNPYRESPGSICLSICHLFYYNMNHFYYEISPEIGKKHPTHFVRECSSIANITKLWKLGNFILIGLLSNKYSDYELNFTHYAIRVPRYLSALYDLKILHKKQPQRHKNKI